MSDWIREDLLLNVAGLPEDKDVLLDYAKNKKWQIQETDVTCFYHFDSLPKKVQVYLAKNDLLDDSDSDSDAATDNTNITQDLDWEQTIQESDSLTANSQEKAIEANIPSKEDTLPQHIDAGVRDVSATKTAMFQPPLNTSNKETATMPINLQNQTSSKIAVLLDVIQLSDQEWAELHQHQIEHVITNGKSDELIALQNQMMANLQKIMQAIQGKLG